MEQMDKVVPGRKNHQRQNEGKTGLEQVLLYFGVYLAAADNFYQVDYDVPAVQNRNREQIDQPEVD